MQITVVVPTYNEVGNLPGFAEALFTLPLSNLKLIIVDDHSPDGTGQVADDLAAIRADRIKVIHRVGKMGLATAYMQGFRSAIENGAEAIAQMDADFSHPPEKLVELSRAIKQSDVAIGSRYVAGGAIDEHWPIWRKGLSAFGNYYARTILGLSIRDVTGGFRLWRKETLLGIPFERVRSNGYAFQVEMAYLACRLGYQFIEVPIYFSDRKWGQSKMNFRIQQEAAIRVWQILLEYRNIKPRVSHPTQ